MLTVSLSCLKTSCCLSGVRDGIGTSEVSCTRHWRASMDTVVALLMLHTQRQTGGHEGW